MKVLIFTEGGSNIGYGHITRCSALYEEIETRGYKVEFIINGDKGVEEVIKGKKFRLVDWRNKECLTKLLTIDDYAIIDSYLADKDIYEFISKKTKKTLYIDDNQRIEYPKGIVVNPSIYGDELSYPKKKGVKYLLGKEYVILRKEFLEVPEKEIRKEIEDVLITFGGSDIKNLTPKVLNILKKYSQINKHIVIGKSFKNIKEIKAQADERTILYYNLDANKMKELMLKCDFAISAAGQTIYELLKMRIPTMVFCVAENQERNVQYLKKTGIAVEIKNFNSDFLKQVSNFQNFVFRNILFNKMSEFNIGNNMKKILDWLGE